AGVFGLQQLKGRRQYGNHILRPAKHDVERRQYGEGADPGAAAGTEHSSGLRDESVALSDAQVARLEGVHVVRLVGSEHGQAKRLKSGFGELAGVRRDALPTFHVAELAQQRHQGARFFEQMELSLQFRGVGGEGVDLFVESGTDRREPRARARGGRGGRDEDRVILAIVFAGKWRSDSQRFPDAGQDVVALAHAHGFNPWGGVEGVRSLQYSRNVARAIGGSSRVFVQGYAGSRRVPLTSRWSGCIERAKARTVRNSAG